MSGRGIHRSGFEQSPELILIATGSEVSLALQTSKLMKDKNIRVISMPCMEIFEKQDDNYKYSIIPPEVV